MPRRVVAHPACIGVIHVVAWLLVWNEAGVGGVKEGAARIVDIGEGSPAANASALLGHNESTTNKWGHSICLEGLVDVVLGVVLGNKGHGHGGRYCKKGRGGVQFYQSARQNCPRFDQRFSQMFREPRGGSSTVAKNSSGVRRFLSAR